MAKKAPKKTLKKRVAGKAVKKKGLKKASKKAARSVAKKTAKKKTAKKKTAKKKAVKKTAKKTPKKTAKKRTPKAKTAPIMVAEELTRQQERQLKKLFDAGTKEVTTSQIKDAVNKTPRKLAKLRSEDKLRAFLRQIELLFRVLRDFWLNDYPLPWRVAAAITVALLYFLNPIDLIPDFIPVIGYVDDVVVVMLCLKLIQVELLEYCEAKGLDRESYGL